MDINYVVDNLLVIRNESDYDWGSLSSSNSVIFRFHFFLFPIVVLLH